MNDQRKRAPSRPRGRASQTPAPDASASAASTPEAAADATDSTATDSTATDTRPKGATDDAGNTPGTHAPSTHPTALAAAIAEATALGGAHDTPDLAPVVGANLRRLRGRRGLSLERLAQQSGVSRAMLGQIELGQSAPTINVLWKISRALGVTFSALISTHGASGPVVMRAADSKELTNHDGTFVSRALFPFDAPRRVEFYRLRLLPGAVEAATAHPSGTTENLVVASGQLELEVDGAPHKLDAGDAILFEADVPHAYRNTGSEEAVFYLVMTYAEEVG